MGWHTVIGGVLIFAIGVWRGVQGKPVLHRFTRFTWDDVKEGE